MATYGQVNSKLEAYDASSGGQKAQLACEISELYQKDGNYKDALKYSEEGYELSTRLGIPQLQLKSILIIGELHEKEGKNKLAVETYKEAGLLAKKHNQNDTRAYCLESVGLLSYKSGDLNSSIEGYNELINCNCGSKKQVASAHEGIALAKYKLGDSKDAINEYGKAAESYKEMGNEKKYLKCSMQQATITANYGDNQKAISLLKELRPFAVSKGESSTVQKIDKLVEDISNNQLARDNSVTEFEENVREEEIAAVDNLKFQNVKSLEEINKLTGDKKVTELMLYAEVQAHKKDQALFQLQNESKQRKLDSTNQELELQQAETSKALAVSAQLRAERAKLQWQLIAVGGILVLMLLLVIVIFRNNRKLKEKNSIIDAKNAELEVKNHELDLAIDGLGLANKNLELTNKHITDSINYASKIQGALLANNVNLNSVFRDHFIFNSPRDIVSGDFSWVDETNADCILVVSDCTGHGVPGALITVLAVGQLEKIVRQQGIRDPEEILAELNNDLHSLFKKSNKSISDGMDIAIVRYDKNAMKLSFAGSRKGVLLMKGDAEDDVTELKGSVLHLGSELNYKEYNKKSLQLEEGDTLFMYTDGYYDQKGGPKGKKFYPKRFKQMLQENKDLPMSDQRRILEETLQEWCGDFERIDDILIVGVRA